MPDNAPAVDILKVALARKYAAREFWMQDHRPKRWPWAASKYEDEYQAALINVAEAAAGVNAVYMVILDIGESRKRNGLDPSSGLPRNET